MTYPTDFCPPNGVEVNDYPTLNSWYYQDVLYIYAKEDAEYTLTDAIQQTRMMRETFGDKKVFVIADVRNTISITAEARKYYKSGEGGMRSTACCFLVNSPVSRVIANLLLTVLDTKMPVKVVNSVEEAIKWGEKNGYIVRDLPDPNVSRL